MRDKSRPRDIGLPILKRRTSSSEFHLTYWNLAVLLRFQVFFVYCNMLYFQQLILVAFPGFLLCSATKVLPRAQHAGAESEAFVEIHNVMLRAQIHPSVRNASSPRIWDQASSPARYASSESPLAAIKRTLLGARQSLTCDPGYGLCHSESLYLQTPEKPGARPH